MITPRDIGDCDGILCFDCEYCPERIEALRADLGCKMRAKFLLDYHRMHERVRRVLL